MKAIEAICMDFAIKSHTNVLKATRILKQLDIYDLHISKLPMTNTYNITWQFTKKSYSPPTNSIRKLTYII